MIMFPSPMNKLKQGSKDISKEVGNYLFENYKCFLKTKDSITDLHKTFLDLQTTLTSSYALTLNAIQTNLEAQSTKPEELESDENS